MKIFLKDWWAGILATVILVIDIMLNFPDNELSLGMILFLVFAFIQMAQPQIKLNNIINAKPVIEVKKAYVDKRSLLATRNKREGDLLGYSSETGAFSRLAYESYETYGGTATYRRFPSDTRVEDYLFAHVVFVNTSKYPQEHTTAHKVWAEIIFYNQDKKLLWNNIKGRWTDTIQPNKLQPSQIKRDLLQVDIAPNQLDWELDIAMRHVDEKIGFVFNNDSYEFVEFQRDDMVLREKKYLVKIVLRGIGLNPNGVISCFVLHNEENIEGFLIEQTDSF
jgi:hypothetical protein